jgi:hypothetical protein
MVEQGIANAQILPLHFAQHLRKSTRKNVYKQFSAYCTCVHSRIWKKWWEACAVVCPAGVDRELYWQQSPAANTSGVLVRITLSVQM